MPIIAKSTSRAISLGLNSCAPDLQSKRCFILFWETPSYAACNLHFNSFTKAKTFSGFQTIQQENQRTTNRVVKLQSRVLLSYFPSCQYKPCQTFLPSLFHLNTIWNWFWCVGTIQGSPARLCLTRRSLSSVHTNSKENLSPDQLVTSRQDRQKTHSSRREWDSVTPPRGVYDGRHFALPSSVFLIGTSVDNLFLRHGRRRCRHSTRHKTQALTIHTYKQHIQLCGY